MDTGLVENIPAYDIQTIALRDGAGRTLGTMMVNGSVAEDPAFTVRLPASASGPFAVSVADTNGRTFAGTIPAPRAGP